MSPFALDRRRFILTGAVACLGASTATAQPKDNAVKARTAIQLRSPDGIDCIDAVAFSADRSLVALFQSDRKIRAWETATGKWRATLGGHRFDEPNLFAVVDNGKTVIAWGETGTCLAWDLKTGEARVVFEKVGNEMKDGAEIGAASPDGKRIATVHDGGGCRTLIRGWDVGTGKELWAFNNANGRQEVYSLAFSPDGKTLAAGTQDGKVKLLDPATAKQTAVLADGTGRVGFLDWSADGKRLAATQRDKGVKDRVVVWDIASGKVAGVTSEFYSCMPAKALSPGGSHIATFTPHGHLGIWAVPGEKPLAEVKVQSRRGLAWTTDGKSVLVVRESSKVLELLTFDLADLVPKKP